MNKNVLSSFTAIISLFFLSTPAVAEIFQWPVSGGAISDYFGTRNGLHFGIDIAAPEGTAVFPIQSGVVTRSYSSESYGEVIFIKHKEGYESVYAHLQKRMVFKGDKVNAQTTVGTVGNTGHSNGNHLHLEMHTGKWTYEKNNAVNPLLFITQPPETIAAAAESNTYTVKEGDTLYGIAKRFGMSLQTLKEENHLATDLILPGQMLLIIR